jgi:hypothetical protein
MELGGGGRTGMGEQGWESRDGRAEVGGHTFDMKP